MRTDTINTVEEIKQARKIFTDFPGARQCKSSATWTNKLVDRQRGQTDGRNCFSNILQMRVALNQKYQSNSHAPMGQQGQS